MGYSLNRIVTGEICLLVDSVYFLLAEGVHTFYLLSHITKPKIRKCVFEKFENGNFENTKF